MLTKTRGIVLNYVKFKETSIIVKIFTEQFGLQTYIVNGARSVKGKGKMALYQPLTILDLVVYRNENKSINRISESRCEYAFTSIPLDVKKSAIVLFCAEMLSKTISDEGMEDVDKFRFVRDRLIHLDKSTTDIEHFPVHFALHLCRFIGFEIESGKQLTSQDRDLDPSQTVEISDYLESLLVGMDLPDTSVDFRRNTLNCVLNYYVNHQEGFHKPRSLQILKQVFS